MIAPYERFRRGWTAFWGTTYTCEVAPVEEYFLSKLSENGLSATLLADFGCLDEAFAAVEPGRLRRLGRDYVLRPVYWRAGAFHPKTFLFGNQHGGVLLVGSGNAGISGFMRGREVFSEFKSTPEERSPEMATWAAWMSQVVEVLGDRLVANRWAELQARLPWLRPSADPSSFVTNWETPLLDQLLAATGDQVDELHVSAPFFDPDVAALERLVAELKPKQISISVGHDAELDGKKLGDLLQRAGVPARVFQFDPDRFVHGKVYSAIQGDEAVVLAGSPNCSRSALIRSSGKGNVEAGVLVRGSAEAGRALLVPPEMARREMTVEAIHDLKFSLSVAGTRWTHRLLRAEILEEARLAIAFVPAADLDVFVQPVGGSQLLGLAQTQTESVEALGEVTLAITAESLTDDVALVVLVDADGQQVSNRVALDDPARLQQALQPRDQRGAAEREIEDEELDPDVLEVLNELRARCSFDVPTAKRRSREQAVVEAAVGDASFWDTLGPIEARQRKRAQPGRFYGRLDEEGIFAQLRAMLLEAPNVPTLRLISQVDETADEDEEAEETRPARSWSSQARKRVRVRNLLQKWFRSVADPQMREFDPDLCLSNYIEMLRGLERLWCGDGQTRLFGQEDLASLWLDLFRALVSDRNPVGLLAGLDGASRDRLSARIRDQGAQGSAALLAFDVLGYADREEKLTWQPLLESALAWGALDSPDEAVMKRIQEVIDFIDDREWCRRIGARLGVSLDFKASDFYESFDRVLEIGDIDDLLGDARVPELAIACLEYRTFDTLILQAKGRPDRIALKEGDTAFYSIGGKVDESTETVWLPELSHLVADAAGLKRLTWKRQAQLA